VTQGPGVVGGRRPAHEPCGDTTNARKQARDRGASDKRRASRGAARPSERRIVPVQVGTRRPRDPREGRRRRASRGAGRHAGRALAITTRHTTTPADGGPGRPRSPGGLDDPGPPARCGLSARRVAPYEPVQRRGHRWGHGAARCRPPRRPPARLARASTPWTLSGSARGACLDRAGRWGPAPDRQADVRGQHRPASGGEAVGSDRRARWLRRLVGLAAGSQPSGGPARAPPAVHARGAGRDRGCSGQGRLRQHRQHALARGAAPAGQGGEDAASQRAVAAGRREGRRRSRTPRDRRCARRRHCTRAGTRLPPSCPRCLVCT